MIIIFPYGHDQLTLSRMPLATMAIIAVCAIVYFPASFAIEADNKKREEAAQKVDRFKENHKYLRLPEDIVSKMPEDMRRVYEKRQEWIFWYKESPEEVEGFLNDWVQTAGRGPSDLSGPLEDLAKDLAMLPGLEAGRARKDVGTDYQSAAVSPEAKAAFLLALKAVNPAALDEQQNEFERLYLEYKTIGKGSRFERFAFVPSRPSLLGVVAHQFIHVDLFHLLLNMLFLWLVAVKLEELWSRPVFIALFLFFGIMGALVLMTVNPQSEFPLVGASGAVAGLMGACLIRLSQQKIRFFYAYWFFSVSPKVGTFKAPAFVMLTLWLVAEVGSAAFFGSGPTAYWSELGGFAVGLIVALIFKLIRFEESILGAAPEQSFEQVKKPVLSADAAARRIPPKRNAPAKPLPAVASPRIQAAPRAQNRLEPALPKEEPLDGGLLLDGFADIDLPVQSTLESYQSDPIFPDIELPPLDETDKNRGMTGVSGPDSPGNEAPGNGEAADKQAGFKLSRIDTSMLDNLAAEAFNSELENIASSETTPNSHAHSLDLKPTVKSDIQPNDLEPLPYLPTMAAPPRDNLEEKPDESLGEFHIELPRSVSLTGLEGIPFSTKPVQTTIREVELLKIMETGLLVSMYGSGQLTIPAEEIKFIAIGRIEKADAAQAAKFFTSGIPPKEPAMILAVIKNKIVGKDRDVILGYAMDESKLRYEKLMRSTFATRLRNFIALTKILLRFYKRAEYLPCPGAIGENNLPLYKDLEEFFGHIEKYAKLNS